MCVLIALALAGASPAGAQGVVFRYLPGHPAWSSVVETEGVEVGPFLDPRALTARAPGGWGMQAPVTAEFDGTASTLRGSGSDPARLVLASGFTVEVWVRPGSAGDSALLLTNRVGDSDGIALGLAGGVPYAAFGLGETELRVDAGEPVAAGEEHWLAATVRSTPDGALELVLYLNGRRRAETRQAADVPTLYALARPFFVGTRATGSAAAPVLEGTFTGQLYAAVVRGYLAHEAYLNTPPPFDGGPYFGLPDYHDYALDLPRLPMDQRIDAAPVPVRRRLFVPHANDEYIPQGTATHGEVSGPDTTTVVYVSSYHRLRDGRIETQRSIVTEMDASTGRVRRTFRLGGRLATAHVGGVAYHRGALYVASQGVVERYPLPAYEPAGPKYADLPPDPAGTVNVASKASFVSVFRDTLWVGDWRRASDTAPFLYAHPIDEAGRPSARAAFVYALPRNIQGVDLTEHEGVVYLFMARNRNSREAELLRYRAGRLRPTTVPPPDTTITMPHGIEDLSFGPDGSLWTNSESGTDYYQRRATNPWSSFYPFVYAVPRTVLLPTATTTGLRDRVLPDLPAPLHAFPNPFSGVTHVTVSLAASGFVRVFVTDALGRRVATLREAALPAGDQTFRWHGAGMAPGLYFVVLEEEQARAVRPVRLVR